MKKTWTYIATLLIAALVGCSNSPPPVAMVQPGTSTRPIGGIQYTHDDRNNGSCDEECYVPTICDFSLPGSTIAIIEGHPNGYERIPVTTDGVCSRYSDSVQRGFVRILAVVSGIELPPEFRVVSLVGLGLPEPEETWLVRLHELRGEWFVTGGIPVRLSSSALQADPETVRGFPPSFEELVEQVTSKMNSFDTSCPELAVTLANRSEAEWERFYYEPPAHYCGPVAPDAGDENPTEDNNGALTEECTDTHPCD